MRAVIILGHGSRSLEATEQFFQLTELMCARQPDDLVLPAFLQLAEPLLPEVVQQALAQGATEIVVLSCFLFQGNHIKQDIPALLEEIKAQHPQVQMHFTRPLGPDPRLVDILLERAEEALCRS